MSYQRIVVKLGTSTLTAGTPKLSQPHLVDLARQISLLIHEGRQVILVSSGAVAAGKETLGYPDLPRYIPAKQMLAAVGQPALMALYEHYFKIYNCHVAQVLLTRADLADRRRYLNARNTLEALLQTGVIPIINENDTLATEEIRFGDNDNLSSRVAALVEADLLILLTDQNGLYTGDPRSDPNARLVPLIEGPEIPAELWAAAGGSSSGLGTGGMNTKLHAADLARRAGVATIIANGSDEQIIQRAAHEEALGTLVRPVTTHLEGRKRYILTGGTESGQVLVDKGAAKALAAGSSLLPAGITGLSGDFERGDTVRVLSPNRKEIAVGLVNYSAQDLALCLGHQSSEIESLLGYTYGDEAIHRNDLILL